MAASPTTTGDDGRATPPFPDTALLEEMEGIPEPAVLYLPGGRIAAVNGAAAHFADFSTVGMNIGELIAQYATRRADGSRLRIGDLPCARALRGEVVDQGERVELTLPDGSVYHALVTARPIVVDGKVMAALSVWHDFDAFLRRLVGEGDGDAGERGDARPRG